MGFASLQHMRHRRYAYRERCLPAKFRLQGLVTLLTVYSLRSRAGFVSHRQRSWDLPFGAFSSWKVTGRFRLGRTHIPFTRRYTLAPKCRGRLDKLQFLGFDPSESPWRSSVCLACRPLVAPLGLTLPGLLAEALTGISPSLLSRASQRSSHFAAGASEYQSVSAPPHPPA
jgi:hypothetical protein